MGGAFASDFSFADIVQPSGVVRMPLTSTEYDQLVHVLDQLIDEVGENEDHSLASLMEVIGVLIERYEDEHVPELKE